MYERSAIVLERYIEAILNLNKKYNLASNHEKYNELIKEIEEYQIMSQKELEIIREFEDTAKNIEDLQQEQTKLYRVNKKLEEDRAQLFTDLGEEPKILENKIKKIENTLQKNNELLKEIREKFVYHLSDFSQKQKNRNKCEKARRIGEAKHIEYIKNTQEEFSKIDVKDVANLKDFINSDKDQVKEEALAIMIKNGKNEKVSFHEDVLKKAISTRVDIMEKEAECYILVYDRMKKLLSETNDSETIRLNKYKKTYRDTSIKLDFLKAQKEYIVSFLDYERMTAISGTRMHKKMMIDACNNYELDMIQIKNLYELILKEIANKATKKLYKELYNKTYLRNIEDKEKNFEAEVNQVNISMGTVINSNYWRIEGIKNIYNVFNQEVSEKFSKDLSEYKLEEIVKEEPEKKEEKKKNTRQKSNKKPVVEVEEIEEEVDDYEDNEEEDIEDDYENEEEDIEEDIEEDYEDDEDIEDDYEDEEDDEEDEEEDYEDNEDEDEGYYEDEEDDDDYYEEDEKYKQEEIAKFLDYDEKLKISNEHHYEYDDDDEYEDIYKYKFDEDDDIDIIIEKSRKKITDNNSKKQNKGLLDKLFKK